MSDFDKEAERQRLREKYEAEREDREATQRMSELLLKGATMTNKHCGNCGDPIFRYDGQEFCPSCSASEQAAADAANGAVGDGAVDDTTDDATASAEPTDAQATADADAPSDDATPSVDVTTEPTPNATNQPARAGAGTHNASPAPGTQPSPDAQHTADAQRAPGTQPAQDAAQPVTVNEDAVANVEATLSRFAAAAANTDDPDRAREYLAVVRDATETLRSLDTA
jgi:uncharacterized Zn finger protein (UPF0148 family)